MLPPKPHKMKDDAMAECQRWARSLCQQFNQSPVEAEEARTNLLRELFASFGEESVIQQPFHCDLGKNITIGRNVFLNYNCIILDESPITIGDHTLIEPNVGIYGASHPISPSARLNGDCWSAPIVIGKNVWIGGNAVIFPGVTIGDNSVIGAGSVVTRDIPPNVVAAGNPAVILRETGI